MSEATTGAAGDISDLADEQLPKGHLTLDYEHKDGRSLVRCLECGAVWKVVGDESGSAIKGVGFEPIGKGSGWCEEAE